MGLLLSHSIDASINGSYILLFLVGAPFQRLAKVYRHGALLHSDLLTCISGNRQGIPAVWVHERRNQIGPKAAADGCTGPVADP